MIIFIKENHNFVKDWYKMMCRKSMDTDRYTTAMTEYCLSDVDTYPCKNCYYGGYIE